MLAGQGEAGYLRVAKGKNMCGLAEQPLQPRGARNLVPNPATFDDRENEQHLWARGPRDGSSTVQAVVGCLGAATALVLAGVVLLASRRRGLQLVSSAERRPLSESLLAAPASPPQRL